MALTIATGFVVDDAIVVLENITRYLEAGHVARSRPRCTGAARDRLHRALDQRLAGRGVHPDPADGRHRRPALPRVRGDARRSPSRVSLVVSLTTTPMMCARAPARRTTRQRARPALPGQRARLRRGCCARYERSARAGCCAIRAPMLAVTLAHRRAQRLPVRDRAQGLLPAAGHRPAHRQRSRPTRTSRFQAMREQADAARATIVQADPGGRHRRRLHRRRRRRGTTNTGAHVRRAQAARASARSRADQVIARLRPQARAACRAPPSSSRRCRTCASAAGSSNAQYQYTLQGDDLDELNDVGAARARRRCASCPSCATSTATSRTAGLQAPLVDRPRHRGAPRHHAAG